VNLINHNLYRVGISAFFYFFYFFGDFFENFSILEVEIGRNGPGILGVKDYVTSKPFHCTMLTPPYTDCEREGGIVHNLSNRLLIQHLW
jgi:hypothetical protein